MNHLHLTCGISSLLHSVNLILFTLLLVHLILCISPHHSHHLRSHKTYCSRQRFTPAKTKAYTGIFPRNESAVEYGPTASGIDRSARCVLFLAPPLQRVGVVYTRRTRIKQRIYRPRTIATPI